ncbi:MAG: zinc-binding dehydrogenase [Bradyrhizobiaceae bacterium]|nr:zinc-binding dehydrogenase [Bradyrhizobiaceae bacterium]
MHASRLARRSQYSGRAAACRKVGAHEVVEASKGNIVEALKDLTGGHGIDVAVNYVSSTATLEASAKALGKCGRLVTLGGAGKPFQLSAMDLLFKEQDILGSRYVSRIEIIETLEIVARGEVWPLVSEIRPLTKVEILHERVERGEVTGRAALLVS